MAEYILTEPAQLDLEEIDEYVESDSGRRAAEHVLDAIHGAINDLVRLPSLGRTRVDVPGDYLFYRVFRYLIVFRRRREMVVILRIIHGARDVPRQL